MDPHELESQLLRGAAQVLTAGQRSSAELPRGAFLVDSWLNERYGGVLFWLDAGLNVHSWGTPVLHDVLLTRDGDGWRPRGSGGSGTATSQELGIEMGLGLHRLGTTSQDPVRLVMAFASPEVVEIELRSAHGASSRQPGRGGFSLLGVTHGDPITYAQALDGHGRPLPGEPLLL